MEKSLPKAHLLAYQDLTDPQRSYLIMRAGSGIGDGLALSDERIFVTFQRANPQKEYYLTSFAHLMTYTPFRRSFRKICQMYRKVKRSNCIVRCYLKTTEVALEEIIETCTPYLKFQVDTIDAMLWFFMNYVDDVASNPIVQFPTISRSYSWLIQRDLETRWADFKNSTFYNIRDLINGVLSSLPECWIPEPFIPVQPMKFFDIHQASGDSTLTVSLNLEDHGTSSLSC
ncbi:hypothetical protein C0J52_24034 [Blattella germanica]|nr:hypothetical protein C0J52_24034 [Blattella germanica]PSN34302.1 hypothetical protein C0J52_24034 [Blattella germanica]